MGATILLEAAEPEFGAAINTMDQVMAWVDRIGSPAFLPMLDTHQVAHGEPSIEHGFRAARGRAPHIHLYDPSRWPPGLLAPGRTLDWPRIGQILRGEGFAGSASVVLAPEGEAAHAAQRTRDYLRALFAA